MKKILLPIGTVFGALALLAFVDAKPSAAFYDRSHATRVTLPTAVPAIEPALYPGNIPARVSKDAKYTCGLDGAIRLLFHLGNREVGNGNCCLATLNLN